MKTLQILLSVTNLPAMMLIVAGWLPGISESSAAEGIAVNHIVEIRQFEFVPASISIQTGDSITWVNRDLVPHTATAPSNAWNTGLIASGARHTLLFKAAFEIEYFCLYHPSMIASLRVTQSV